MNIYKTIFTNTESTNHRWLIVDASGLAVGRVAAAVAAAIRGKNNPQYTSRTFTGDYVVIINASKVILTGKKPQAKLYRHYTGFVGGLKSVNFNTLIKRHPEEPLRIAINGMLPSGHLGRKLMNNVKIFSGSEHPYKDKGLKQLSVR